VRQTRSKKKEREEERGGGGDRPKSFSSFFDAFLSRQRRLLIYSVSLRDTKAILLTARVCGVLCPQ